jgi:hypothetical protein
MRTHADPPAAPVGAPLQPVSAGSGTLLALLALVVLGAAFRLPVAHFGLPHLSHYDEYFTLTALDALRNDPEHARSTLYYNVYPHFTQWLTLLIAPDAVALAPGDLAHHLQAASRDLWIVRLVSSCLSLLAVPGTWLLARRFVSQRTALLAAAFVAVSLMHVWYSVHAKPHGPGSGTAVLAVVAAVELRRRGTALWYLLAGLSAGVAIGCSQAGLLVLPAFVCAHLLRERSGSRLALLWFAAGAALCAACMFSFGENWLGSTVAFGEHSLFGQKHFSPLDIAGLVLEGLWHFDPLLSALALGSALAWPIWRWRTRVSSPSPAPLAASGDWFLRRWLRGREDLAVVLAHVLPYCAALSVNQHGSHRYFLMLWPYALCVAAWGTICASSWCARKLAARPWASALARAAPVALVVLEGACALRMNMVQLGPDTGTRAAEWIEHNLDPRSTRIAVIPGLDLPLLRQPREPLGEYEKRKATAWARYQNRLGDMERGTTTWQMINIPRPFLGPVGEGGSAPPLEPAAIDADYVVLALDDRKFMADAIERVRAIGTRVARFSPMEVDEGDDTPFLWWDAYREYQEGCSRLWRMLHARSIGGVVEIYRVERRDPAGKPVQER